MKENHDLSKKRCKKCCIPSYMEKSPSTCCLCVCSEMRMLHTSKCYLHSRDRFHFGSRVGAIILKEMQKCCIPSLMGKISLDMLFVRRLEVRMLHTSNVIVINAAGETPQSTSCAQWRRRRTLHNVLWPRSFTSTLEVMP